MTIAVFIAKDENEFDAYNGTPYDTTSGFDSDSSDDGADDLMDNIGDTASIKMEMSDDRDSVCVVLKRSPNVDVLKDVIRTGRVADACLATLVKDYIENKITEVGVSEPASDNVVYVFCHWGNGGDAGGVADMDNAFQEVFARWKESNDAYAQWDFQAISSMRKEIFNVTDVETGAKWGLKKLPISEAEVKELSSQLAAESEKHSNRVYKYSYKAQDFASPDKNGGMVSAIVPLLIIPVTAASTVGRLAEVIKTACCGLGYVPLEIDKLSGDEKFYPFFVDFEYAMGNGERIRAVDGSGFSVPDEFILRFEKGRENKSDGALTVDLVRDMQQRIKAWMADAKLRNGLSVEDIKDWIAGAFRRFCMLDEDVHGTDGTIDVKDLKADPCGAWRKYKEQLRRRYESESLFKRLREVVFKSEMASLSSLFIEGNNLSDEECGKKFIKEVIYEPGGSQVAYFSPVIRFSGLLIDDDAENAKKDIEARTKPVMAIEPISVRADIPGDNTVVRQAISQFRQISDSHKSYDFVLLDLRLADHPGHDPSGYQLIKYIKQFFPQIPVVIYSRYDDMGHISRAFAAGADWFIRKEDVEKLPRHMISLLSFQKWGKEWDSLGRLGLCDRDMFSIETGRSASFCSEHEQERMYLTYKVLEKLPGKRIHIKPMGGGMSSAVTFKAWKTIEGHEKPLQSPIIVKIDSAFNTMTEFERYFRFIRPYIANECGRIETKNKVVDKDNSAIVYSFAGKNDPSHNLSTMKEKLSNDIKFFARCDYEKYASVFDSIFDDILPKIHGISFDLEIEKAMSSFPNHILGEKVLSKNGFVGNYLSRMPIAKYYDVECFVSQEEACVRRDPKIKAFEFHGLCKDDVGRHAIEAYEIQNKQGVNDYSKITVVLKGVVAEHVAKYRHPMPGQTLYAIVKNSEVEPKLDGAILKSIKERLYPDSKSIVVFYNGDEQNRTSDDNKFKYSSDNRDPDNRCKQCIITLIENLLKGGRNGVVNISGYGKLVLDEKGRIDKLVQADTTGERFNCQQGIIHGDMNYANIMLDEKNGNPEKDVWLIDFARTRRDYIAHDFNVMFSATISLLFDNDLWNDEGVGGSARYAARLVRIFRKYICDAMFSVDEDEPDYIANDRRFTLVYKILRRIRRAALKDKQMTPDMYTLTTALCCLYTFKIYLKHDHNIQAAACFLAIAHICIERLESGGDNPS